jgi:flagellar biosynthetic protein FlhB
MASSDDTQDKQLPATERKIRKAREEGQIARSRDLGHAAAFAAAGVLLVGGAAPLTDWLRQLLADGLRFDAATLARPDSMTATLWQLTLQGLWLLLPLGAVVFAVALASGVAAGGWNFSWKAMAPRWSKLSPLAGIGRMFSKHQLTEMLKACVLALVLGAIGAAYVRTHLEDFALLVTQPLPLALSGAGNVLVGGLALLLLALAAFALVDVPLQRQLLLSRLKMSRQEVKQEMKEQEGNPEVKGRIRQKMRELANRRMLAAVPQADLVVMNPTHFAVALKYDEATMTAPRVVAKGADLMAFRIRDAAKSASVPVLQAPPLARALYKHAEVDREIPAALFAAVAQVLAWVYQLRAAAAARRPLPAEPQSLPVPPELDPGPAPAAADDA